MLIKELHEILDPAFKLVPERRKNELPFDPGRPKQYFEHAIAPTSHRGNYFSATLGNIGSVITEVVAYTGGANIPDTNPPRLPTLIGWAENRKVIKGTDQSGNPIDSDFQPVIDLRATFFTAKEANAFAAKYGADLKGEATAVQVNPAGYRLFSEPDPRDNRYQWDICLGDINVGTLAVLFAIAAGADKADRHSASAVGRSGSWVDIHTFAPTPPIDYSKILTAPLPIIVPAGYTLVVENFPEKRIVAKANVDETGGYQQSDRDRDNATAARIKHMYELETPQVNRVV